MGPRRGLKVLFIGGTGNISTAVSRRAVAEGIDLHLMNRGRRKVDIPGVRTLAGDISDPAAVAEAIRGMAWDVVVNWIAFTLADVERDIALFAGRTRQYIFISSASAYQKPPSTPYVTESTPLANPYWEYSRNKIACEERLTRALRETGFPAVIVRPSLTYDTVIPLALGGWTDYTIIDRMKRGLPVIVHGDGTSLWQITHAEDFARGFVPLMGLPTAVGHAFHITTDEVLNWNQIYQMTAAAAGVEANLVHIPTEQICTIAETLGAGWLRGNFWGDKSWSVILDNSKIKRFVPDFVATIPYARGIARTLDHFHADPERCKVADPEKDLVGRILSVWQSG